MVWRLPAVASAVPANGGGRPPPRLWSPPDEPRPPALDADRGLLRPVHDPARRHDRERGSALDPAGAGRRPRHARLDHQRVRAAAGLVHPGRRHARRPLRTQARLRPRVRPLHAVLGRLRALHERPYADRVPRAAGLARRCLRRSRYRSWSTRSSRSGGRGRSGCGRRSPASASVSAPSWEAR